MDPCKPDTRPNASDKSVTAKQISQLSKHEKRLVYMPLIQVLWLIIAQYECIKKLSKLLTDNNPNKLYDYIQLNQPVRHHYYPPD